MKIDTLKELEKFIALCRKTGITDVKIDGMEFHLGAAAPQIPRKRFKLQSDPLAEAKITVPTFGGSPDETPEQAREKYNKRKTSNPNQQVSQAATDIINTPDELTEEELLFYSAGGVPTEDAQ